MKHVDQPRLCDKCLAQVHTDAAMGPLNDSVIKGCACAGDDAVVIAVARMREGRIVGWEIEGPMSYVEAAATQERILDFFRKSSAMVHQLRKQ